jgi:hypothetical protein
MSHHCWLHKTFDAPTMKAHQSMIGERMKSAPEFVLPPASRLEMEELIANAVFAYLHEFAQQLFPDYRSNQSLDILMSSVAQAVCRIEKAAERPCAVSLAISLLDQAGESTP